MRPVIISAVAVLMIVSSASAGPLDESQALYDLLVKSMDTVVDAIESRPSSLVAESLKTDVAAPVSAATKDWDDTATLATNYRDYAQFRPCFISGQLLGYLTEEVVQHHLGNDIFQGTMKYRHAAPLIEMLADCSAQLSGTPAETTADAAQR